MRSARPDQLNLILHDSISHPGNAKLRLWFDGIFLKTSRVYFCAVVKYQLEHYKKRKGTVIKWTGGRSLNTGIVYVLFKTLNHLQMSVFYLLIR